MPRIAEMYANGHYVEKDYGKEFVHFGGLKIFTTLDTRYQEFALSLIQGFFLIVS